MTKKNKHWGVPISDTRIEEMIDLHASGQTLQSIGDIYSLSKERVRQLLSSQGVTKHDGGVHVRAKRNSANKVKVSDELKMTRFGCTKEQWDYYRAMDDDYKKTPLCFFFVQKSNAKARGICWDLSINEWWYVWNESGKLGERGRGKYVMARHGDEGGYTLGNVYITTASENSAEYYMLHMDDYINTLIKRGKQ